VRIISLWNVKISTILICQKVKKETERSYEQIVSLGDNSCQICLTWLNFENSKFTNIDVIKIINSYCTARGGNWVKIGSRSKRVKLRKINFFLNFWLVKNISSCMLYIGEKQTYQCLWNCFCCSGNCLCRTLYCYESCLSYVRFWKCSKERTKRSFPEVEVKDVTSPFVNAYGDMLQHTI